MTFRIKLLSAAALLAMPAVAGAQATQPQPAQPSGTTMEGVNRTVQQAQDANPPAGEQVADEQPRQAEQTPPQPAQQPADETPPAPAASAMTPSAATPPAASQSTAQPPAAAQAAQPPAQAQAQPAQAQAAPTAQTQAGAVTAATAADVTAGAQIRDTAGAEVATVVSVDADSAIVSTGSVRADIPIASFGRNAQGLVLAMTRTQLEAAARAAAPGAN